MADDKPAERASPMSLCWSAVDMGPGDKAIERWRQRFEKSFLRFIQQKKSDLNSKPQNRKGAKSPVEQEIKKKTNLSESIPLEKASSNALRAEHD